MRAVRELADAARRTDPARRPVGELRALPPSLQPRRFSPVASAPPELTTPVGRQNSVRVAVDAARHHGAVLDWVSLLLSALRAKLRGRQTLVLENLLLLQQLAVALRSRPRPRLRRRD